MSVMFITNTWIKWEINYFIILIGVYAKINLPLSQQPMDNTTIWMARNIIPYRIYYKLSIGEGYEDWAHIIQNNMSKCCYHKN